MEIEIGEYIRTELGDIKQITEGFEFIIELHNKSSNKIVKHSKNIIDLIEVEDILELKEYIDRFSKSEKIGVSDTTMLNTIRESILEKKIKLISILTKEQYTQNCYKLEE